ncbi:helicase associated domain-containing protein [uncultured Acetatifactor sp.]|uniref:helicase associated domain-containing protein n=1 Tax=uncultured Acetatifactor sp. TaxID=1671927 RepID=UPI0026070B76|nr:helicase associated domain-containing protein [uncultured Acetatifactor sp.]
MARKSRERWASAARKDEELDAIGMRWGGGAWEARYRLAERYYREHGDLRVPRPMWPRRTAAGCGLGGGWRIRGGSGTVRKGGAP